MGFPESVMFVMFTFLALFPHYFYKYVFRVSANWSLDGRYGRFIIHILSSSLALYVLLFFFFIILFNVCLLMIFVVILFFFVFFLSITLISISIVFFCFLLNRNKSVCH